MYSLDYSVTSWGSPAAPKRALLLHGMMGTGGVFFKVADILIKHGEYVHLDMSGCCRAGLMGFRLCTLILSPFPPLLLVDRMQRVDCPDLLGHGWAPHAPSSDRYTISLLASHLAKHLSQEKYGIIGGVSWGCPVILALLPQLQHPPPRVVLVEPILDLAPLPQARIDGMLASTKTPPTEEALLKDNPDWSQEEAVLKRLAFMQMDPRAITDLFEVSRPQLSQMLRAFSRSDTVMLNKTSRSSRAATSPTPSSPLPPLSVLRNSSSSLAIRHCTASTRLPTPIYWGRTTRTSNSAGRRARRITPTRRTQTSLRL